MPQRPLQPSSVTDELLASWLVEVVRKGWEGVEQGQSPFAAAVYTAEGEQLALNYNSVARLGDPSAHAEVTAIRHACRRVGVPQLRDCWLVSSCEPCPMCAAAIVLAGITNVAFGSELAVAARAGFATLSLPCRQIFEHASNPIHVRGAIQQQDCDELLLSQGEHG